MVELDAVRAAGVAEAAMAVGKLQRADRRIGGWRCRAGAMRPGRPECHRLVRCAIAGGATGDTGVEQHTSRREQAVAQRVADLAVASALSHSLWALISGAKALWSASPEVPAAVLRTTTSTASRWLRQNRCTSSNPCTCNSAKL